MTARTEILQSTGVEAVCSKQGRPYRLLVRTSAIIAVACAFVGVYAATDLSVAGEQTDLVSAVVFWISGLAAAIVDMVADAISMVPLIEELGGAINGDLLFSAVALGFNLGGTAAVLSASQIVVLACTTKARGQPIGFLGCVRYGVPRSIATMIIGETAIWLRYQVLLS